MIINKPESVTQKAVGAIKWSALMEVMPRAISSIVFLLLVRLLTPEDFGVMSAAMTVIGFAQIFWDIGLGKALIQTKEKPEKAANVVFWTNLLFGIGVYTGLFLMAPWLVAFFDSPASISVFRILGLQIVIDSLASVQSILFIRDLAFRQLFQVKLVTAFMPGFFSIPLALFGHGVWALVAGSLAGAVCNLTLVWTKSLWRPQLSFDYSLASKLFGFGFWVVLEGFGVWFYLWGDNLLVAKLIGIEELGIYSIAWNINSFIFGLLQTSFLRVLYSTFSRLRDDEQTLKATFHKANLVIISLALPVGVMLFLLGHQFVLFFFRNRWEHLGSILGIIGLMHGMMSLVDVNTELYRAMGRPDLSTKLFLGGLLYYIPSCLVAAHFGLEAFTLARLGVEAIFIPIQVYLCVRVLEVSAFYLWYECKSIFIAALAMSFVILRIKNVFDMSEKGAPTLLMLVILIAAGAIVYTGTLWLLNRQLVLQIKDMIRRMALA